MQNLHNELAIKETLLKIEGHLKAFIILQVIREMEQKTKAGDFNVENEFGNIVIDNKKYNEHKKIFVSRLYGDL